MQFMRRHFSGFLDFIREQGVVGLAVGFILGGAVSKVVTALVNDIINPIITAFMGRAEGLRDAKLSILGAEILWGDFAAVFIDFVIVAAVVYFGIKLLGFEKLDKKKDAKK